MKGYAQKGREKKSKDKMNTKGKDIEVDWDNFVQNIE